MNTNQRNAQYLGLKCTFWSQNRPWKKLIFVVLGIYNFGYKGSPVSIHDDFDEDFEDQGNLLRGIDKKTVSR